MIVKHGFCLLALGLFGAMAVAARGENPKTTKPPDAVFAAMMKAWQAPADPMHVAGPIYFVGTKGLCVWLITTPAGHILLGGGMPSSASLIADSVRKLGFKVEDIKILLSNHAHFDHVGTLAELKKLSGGRVMAMEADVALLASGGKLDYLFANEDRLHFPPVAVDRALKDGDIIEFGGVRMTAHHTPGHTRGCAVFTMTVEEGGQKHAVVFADGTSVNPGTRFLKNPSYPGILEDYRRTFALLETLKPDIFLAYHVDDCGFPAKRERAAKEGWKVFLDPEGYRSFIEGRKAKFEGLVEMEEGGN